MTTKELKFFIFYPSIKTLCLFLLSLCVVDAVFTDLGLATQQIKELNPIMSFIYYEIDVSLFYVIKVGLPVVLLLLHNMINSKLLYICLSITISLYLGVLFLHVHWIFVVFFLL